MQDQKKKYYDGRINKMFLKDLKTHAYFIFLSLNLVSSRIKKKTDASSSIYGYNYKFILIAIIQICQLASRIFS